MFQAFAQIKVFLFNKPTRQRLDVLGMPYKKFKRRLLRWLFLPEQTFTIELKPRVKLEIFDIIDLKRFHTVFIEDRFFIPLRTNEPLLVSVGSRNGFDIIKFDLDYPSGKLLVLEPSAENRSVIKENFAKNRVDASILPFALAGESGKTFLYREVSREGDRYLLDAIKAQSFTRVETRTMAWLLNHLLEPIDLILLNVPGKEEEIILSINDHMAFMIKRLLLKENTLLINAKKIVRHMQSLGYFHEKRGRYHVFMLAT